MTSEPRVIDLTSGEELATAEGTYDAVNETRKAESGHRDGVRGPIKTGPPDSVDKAAPA